MGRRRFSLNKRTDRISVVSGCAKTQKDKQSNRKIVQFEKGSDWHSLFSATKKDRQKIGLLFFSLHQTTILHM